MKLECTVQCVACRTVYVADPKAKPGCPQCGCPSWVSTRIAEASPNGQARLM
jgi:predicted  nucleic acid-binding Zn-ribbon protein